MFHFSMTLYAKMVQILMKIEPIYKLENKLFINKPKWSFPEIVMEVDKISFF